MPRITDMITVLQAEGKRYNSPQWWNSQHKLGKVAKANKRELLASIKANSVLNSSYRVCDDTNYESIGSLISRQRSSIDNPQYSELAPWNSVFVTKYKPIILFRR